MKGILIVLCVVSVVPGCHDPVVEPGHPDPSAMFEHLIQKPIPAGVTDLQGYGETWQGYTAYLRFKAPKSVTDSLVSGYRPTSWSEVSAHLFFPTGPGSYGFSPTWDPASISVKECYEAHVTNDWTHDGTSYFIIDRSTGTVYFYGQGA